MPLYIQLSMIVIAILKIQQKLCNKIVVELVIGKFVLANFQCVIISSAKEFLSIGKMSVIDSQKCLDLKRSKNFV